MEAVNERVHDGVVVVDVDGNFDVDFKFDFVVCNMQGVTVTKALQIEVDYLRGHRPLFMCLSETWLREADMGGVCFSGYVLGSYYCRKDRIRGGVACYAHDTVKFDVLDVSGHCVELDMEVCGIMWRVSDKLSVCIIACYRSPSASIDTFLAKVGDLLNSLYVPTVPVIFTGDVNISPEYNPDKYVDLANLFAAFNMTNKVHEPTRVTSRSASRIDHIWTNFEDAGDARVRVNPYSDHHAVLFASGVPDSGEIVRPKVRKRLYNDGNLQRFLSGLAEEQWDDVLLSSSFESMFNSFYGVFMYHFNEHFPIVCITPKEVTRSWISLEVRESSCRLRDLYVLQRRYPILREAYRSEKSRHTRLVGAARRAYYQMLISSNDRCKQGQAMWRVIGELTNRRRDAANMVLEIDGLVVEDPIRIANEFNNYFIETPLKMLSSLKQGADGQGCAGSRGVGVRAVNSVFIERFTEPELGVLIGGD